MVKIQFDYLQLLEVRWTGQRGKVIVVHEGGREVMWDISHIVSARAMLRE